MNHKSRKTAAAAAATAQQAKLVPSKKLSSFQQAKLNARASRYTVTESAPVEKADTIITEEEYNRYVVTCEESYDIMKQTFALYTQYPDALYVI